MEQPKDRQLAWVTFTNGKTELARFSVNHIILNRPGVDMGFPPRFCGIEDVLSWEPADESELDYRVTRREAGQVILAAFGSGPDTEPGA